LKRTKEEAQVTKEKLINTALKEFLETGFEESKLEDIAAKAGVTRGALYWHFKDKKDLLESIIEYKDIESLKICSEIYESQLPPADKLKEIVSLNFPDLKTAKQEANYVRLKVELYNYFIKNGDKRNVAATFLSMCHSLLKQMKEDDLIKEGVDIKIAAFNILALGSGSFIRYNSLPEDIRTLKTLKKYALNYFKLIFK
jgi:AcrR family transcriptional regulator